MPSHATDLIWGYAVFLIAAAALLAPLIWAAVLDGRYHALRVNRVKRS